MEQVVLVDKSDNKIGLMEKVAAHCSPGRLHRAVSVVLYRKKDGKTEILVQKRGHAKPTWPLFWSNTICTHPRDGETTLDCAVRRLKEEMGVEIKPKDLTFVGKLLYQASFTNQLSEHELDSVFVGWWDEKVIPNREEAEDYKWMLWQELVEDIGKNSSLYTPWFRKLVMEKHIAFD